MVLIGRFFLSPGFLDAQDCKHQGDIGVANRPKKKKPLMSQPGMRFVDLQNLTTPEILPSIFLRSSYMPSTKAKEVGRIVPLALFDYL